MMNFFGKLFVVCTFSLSVLFLAMAIGVYGNHVTFKSKDPKGGPGLIDRAEQKIKELAYSKDRAEEHYRKAYNELGQSEATREFRQRYYVVKYNMLKTGLDDKNQPVQQPVQELERDKVTGEVAVNRLIGPTAIQARGEPLMSLDAYHRALAVRAKDITDEQAKISKLQVELATLTTAMQGGANIVADPGLIRLKEMQVDARRRADAEQEFLKPTLANRFAEAVLLLKREAGLRRRLDQLSGARTTAAGN